MASLHELEERLLDAYAGAHDPAETPVVFLIASPRTGSTLLYQAFLACYDLPYLANVTNDYFAATPIVGLSLQQGHCRPQELVFRNRFGKTDGLFQPSEASAVMQGWFGGGHPSQVVSTGILEGRETHFLRTLAAARGIYQRPLVIKNAWNCFRLEYLARRLPNAFFLWGRRDLVEAAKSDLEARYLVQGSPHAWNSATPWNVDSLREAHYAKQVVENQYEFNAAVERALARHAPGRHATVWYEDLCRDPQGALAALERRSPLLSGRYTEREIEIRPRTSLKLDPADERAVEAYAEEQGERLATHARRARTEA